MKQKPIPERLVMKAITQYLDLLGLVYVRVHPVRPVGKQGAVRFVPTAAGQVGAPDLIVFGYRWVLALEVKASNGKQSESQRGWEARVEKLAHTYRVARSIEDIQVIMKHMPAIISQSHDA